MKKIAYLVLYVSLMLNVYFFAFGSTTQASAKATSPDPSTYYLGVWQECQTLIVQYGLNTEDHVNVICTQHLQTALKNNFFKNRYSDMFSPMPLKFK